MTPMRLTTWFRRRMAVLVAVSMLLAWAALTVGFHLQERRELIRTCRADAVRVALSIAEEIQRRPMLWRYDGAKMSDRIASQGVRPATAIVVRDVQGASVDIEGFRPASGVAMLWGRAPVLVGNVRMADVWVGRASAPLWRRSAMLAAISGLVALLLASMLYVVPVRTVARAERRIVSLMSRLALTMQEGERARIARDLHDGAGQAITAARLGLLALRKRQASLDADASIDAIAATLDGALDEIRRSCGALAPPSIGELGLQGAIRRHCEAFASASGLAIECNVAADLPDAVPHVQVACYRIVQEALANCARHAGAHRIVVSLRANGGQFVLEVVDDGKGFEPATVRMGTGLQSIQERARLLGGSFEVHPAHPGTAVRVAFPLDGGEP